MESQFRMPKKVMNTEVNKQSIARNFGVNDNEVCYAKPGQILDGYKVIYDRVTQRSYRLPAGLVGVVQSLSVTGILNYVGGSVDLGDLAFQRKEYCNTAYLVGTAFIVNTHNETVLYNGRRYCWAGALPKTMSASDTPLNAGGISAGNWVQIDKTTDVVSVTDFGAKGDGTTDDTDAFLTAYNNVSEGGIINIPPGKTFNVIGFSGNKKVYWVNNGSTVLNGVVFPGVNISGSSFKHYGTTSTDTDTFTIFRNADYTGGSHGYVNAAIRATTNSGPSATAFEWAIVGIVNNNSPAGVENVGGYFQGNMKSTGGTWGAVAEATDMNFNGNIGRRELVGAEIDVYCNGPDTAVNRVGAQIVVGDAYLNRNGSAGQDGSATYGLHVMRQLGGATVNWINGVIVSSATDTSFQAGATGARAFRVIGSYSVGLETHEGTLSGPAVRIGAGQKISFNATDTVYAYSQSDALIMGAGSSDRVVIDSGSLRPFTDNSISAGSPTARYTTVYAATGTINTSDGRCKTNVRDVSEKEKAVATKIKGLLKAFNMVDAVEEKGNDARIHFGIIAQDVKAAFEAEGLVAEDYALFCYDKWDTEYRPIYATRTATREVPVQVIEVTKNEETGEIMRNKTTEITQEDYEEIYDTGEKEVVKEAGDRYGIRYDQLLCFIISAL